VSAPVQHSQRRHLARPRNRARRRTRVVPTAAIAVLVTTLSTLLVPTPASAAGYIYHVGHIMNFPRTGDICTGGYAVRGASGMFVTTAGHCSTNDNGNGTTGHPVHGATRQFGTVIRNDFRVTTAQTFDAALVALAPGDDAYQIVVDPITGRSPGDGRVRGYYANSALTSGFRIGKMGRTTGSTEGLITGWAEAVHNDTSRELVLCTTARVSGGDSGGPVWRVDGNGVMAIGIVKLRLADGGMCFKTIEDTLRQFGAWLPVFARNNVLTNEPGAARVVTEPTGLPLPTKPKQLTEDDFELV
jgi:hypothetical protein